jgi:dTDP-4-amino-4,6-dideoxygalactose transaminase
MNPATNRAKYIMGDVATQLRYSGMVARAAVYLFNGKWLTVILITPEEFGADRETVRLALEEENVESRPVWKPMNVQPVFRVTAHSSKPIADGNSKNSHKARPSEIRSDKLNAISCDSVNLTRQAVVKEFHGARVVSGEVAEDLFNRGLCLPSGTAITEKDLNRVIQVIKACYASK